MMLRADHVDVSQAVLMFLYFFMGSLYELRSTLFSLKLLPLEEFDESDQQFACYGSNAGNRDCSFS